MLVHQFLWRILEEDKFSTIFPVGKQDEKGIGNFVLDTKPGDEHAVWATLALDVNSAEKKHEGLQHGQGHCWEDSVCNF